MLRPEVLAWELRKRLPLEVGDRLIVLGTTGSIWDSVLETLAWPPDTLEHEREDLMDAVAEQNVKVAHLDPIQSGANKFLDFELCLRLIQQGRDIR